MDRKLKDELMKKSNYPDDWKEEIWGRLEAQLDRVEVDATSDNTQSIPAERPEPQEEPLPQRSNNNKNKHKGMRTLKIWIGVATAAVAATVFLSLPAGTAMMNSVKNWFVPEKKIEIEVEGHKEETNGQVHVDDTSDYAIYYDKDRYKLVEGDGKDVITTIDPLPEPYPEVSLTIEQKADVLPEELAKQIAGQLQGEYARVDAIERVTAPVDGYLVHAIDGSDRLSEVTNVYVVSNKKQGSFVLSGRYFLEAAEGHGARFYHTLEQFEVLADE
ncbi:hypothetical protein [Paenibacillus arenilitoris]|uniref:Uncharacterized protein n=1 Tax=Paenibacillus arenilitoris TaxID=2772299 RepID=A0A927CVG2_9BACL|nr:hypothetical protein [Paenibacillus arenilitoris]MBD2872946.1 hypothetical protein [Paenibacillus arenilitoris]